MNDGQSTTASGTSRPVTTETLRGWVADLRRVHAVDETDRVEQLRLLEELKNAAGSAQAVGPSSW